MFAGGMGSQAFGLISTMLLVRFVGMVDYGEAIAAAVVMGTAAQFSTCGIGQFVIVKARDRRDVAFHGTFFGLVLGFIAIGLVFALEGPLSRWIHSPGMARYMPGMALSMIIDRVGLVPERQLMGEMRFRPVAVGRTLGEFCYSGTSLVLSILGWGGMAIVMGNLARSVVRTPILVSAVERRAWLQPCPIRKELTVEMFRYGLPLSVGSLATYASKKWDNLLVAHFFGPAVMSAYNVAYGLAETPSALIGDQVVDVLLPSFTRVGPDKRESVLQRGAALMSLITAPTSIGLGAVAVTLVASFLPPKLEAVGPMLAILSVISVTKPLAWISTAYLQARHRTGIAMALDVLNVVAILAGVATFGRFGILLTCAAVGVGTLLRALVGAYAIGAIDQISVLRFLGGQVGPLLACAPMVGAVLGVRWLLHHAGIDIKGVNLAIEVVAGGLAYLASAFLFAGETARDFLALVKNALLKRRGKETEVAA
jgi:PST family polysaccharide transporter